jgi:hypothetical protein
LRELRDLDDDMTLKRRKRVVPDVKRVEDGAGHLVVQLLVAWGEAQLVDLLAVLLRYIPAGIVSEFLLGFRWVFIISTVVTVIKITSLIISGSVGLFTMMLAFFGLSLFQ